MNMEAIKEAIQQLPESARRELADWFEEEFIFPEDPQRIHEEIGVGLAQLDRGEGVPGEESRAVLREKKSSWINRRQQRE
jgi:hypothetical protein